MADDRSQATSRQKTMLFRAVAITLPVIVLVLAEAALRLAGVGEEYRRPFVPVEGKPEVVSFSPDFAMRYFGRFQPSVAFNPFEPAKPDSTFRVFALGGSTTAGFPYSFYYGFPGRLQSRLDRYLPGMRAEVINLGMTAVNTYTLWHLKDYLSKYDPDAIIIYAGHNEYYGAFGAASTIYSLGNRIWLKRLTLRLKSAALYVGLERLIVGGAPGEVEALEGQSRTMMSQVVGSASIRSGSDEYRSGIAQFEANLVDVVDYFRHRGIPVYVATLTSNLLQPPLSGDSSAVASFREAIRLLEAGESGRARSLFLKASEEDGVRFRAPDSINDVIREIAAKPGVSLVEVQERFRNTSETGVEGGGQFVDHLHPTADGYDQIAAEFFESLIQHPRLRDVPSQPWSEKQVLVDPIDRATAEIQVLRLKGGFPFRKGVDARTELRLYNRILDRYSRSGAYADSLAVLAMTRSRPIYDLLYDGARTARARSDTLDALLFYKALLHWQPFNEAVSREAVAYALADPSYDRVTSELAAYMLNRSGDQPYLDALAAIRLRQGAFDAAERLLNASEQLDPSSQPMLYNKARLHAMRGDSAMARSYLERLRMVSNG